MKVWVQASLFFLLIPVMGFDHLNAIEPSIEESLLAGNWEAVYRDLPENCTIKESPICTFLRALACDATNRTTEAKMHMTNLEASDIPVILTWTDSLLQRNSENPVSHYLLGFVSMICTNFELAIRHFTKAIEQDNDFSLAFTARGLTHFMTGNNYASVLDLSRSIEIDSTNALAFSYLATTYRHIDRPEDAIPLYIRAIELDSTFVAAYNNRALAFLSTEEFDKAIRDFEKTLELDSNLANVVYANLGYAYDEKNDFEKAIYYYNEGLKIDPDDALLYNNRGGAFFLQEEFQDAIVDFNKAIELDSAYLEAYLNLHLAYDQLGLRSSADKIFTHIANLLSDTEVDPSTFIEEYKETAGLRLAYPKGSKRETDKDQSEVISETEDPVRKSGNENMKGIWNVLRWVLWGIVAVISISWAIGCRTYVARNQSLQWGTIASTMLLCTMTVLFIIFDWNKLHILWIAPLIIFVPQFIILSGIPILSPLLLALSSLFLKILTIGLTPRQTLMEDDD